MKLTLWKVVFSLVVFTLGTFYILLRVFHENQSDDIRLIVLKSIQSDMSEISYTLSKNMTSKEHVKNFLPLFERYVSNNDFVSYIMLLEKNNILITTNLSHTKVIENIALYTNKYKHLDNTTFKNKQGIEGNVRYFQDGNLKTLRLILVFDKEEIDYYLKKQSHEFWIYFGAWSLFISVIIILIVQFLFIHPLTLLYRYTYNHVNIPNKLILDDFESIRLSMVENHYKIKQKQTELSKFQIALEQSPISIIITDIKGNIEYVNPYFSVMTGYSSKEAIGNNPRFLASGFTEKKEYEALWKDVLTSKIWRGSFKNTRKNGEEYWESAIIAPVKNSEWKIINLIGIKQDISEKIKMESMIHEQEELMISQSRQIAMGEMIGMIAHQWRQPLSVISMGANNILLDIEMDEIQTEVFKNEIISILDQVKHLSSTIDDFRNYFHPNKEKEFISIDSVVKQSLSVISKSLEHHNINVESTLCAPDVILIYERELMQVLINIINNAKEALLEFARTDMHITINTSETDKEVFIKICDNGGGIKKEIEKKIFEPYFSTKDEKTGTGLGLYISKTIVEKHLNGIIEVENNIPNGTCFSIRIEKRDI